MKTQKILFVIKSLRFPGGAERVLALVSSGLAARGHEVSIATFDAPHSYPFYPISDDVRLIHNPVGDSQARTGPLEMARRILSLGKTLREHRPDAAVGFMHSSYVPLSLAALGTGVPVLASEHIVYDHYADRPLERLLIRLASPLLSGVTAISEPMKEGFPTYIREKMTLVPNPVEVPELRAARGKKRDKIVLAVGRLEHQKDHSSLVSAFASLAPRHPDWRLRIVGEGVLRPALKRQVRALRIEDVVEMPGLISDVSEEYAAAQIFAMPSLYESFGLATAEALSAGLPAIGFADCAGTNELIKNGENGILVDSADRVAGLSAALERLMNDSRLRNRLAAAGPSSVNHLSIGKVIDLWEDLIERAGGR